MRKTSTPISRCYARDLNVVATLLSGHEEDRPGSLEVLVVLVGEQLVDLLLPVVIVGRDDVFRGRRDAPLLVAAAAIAAGYNLVIL